MTRMERLTSEADRLGRYYAEKYRDEHGHNPGDTSANQAAAWWFDSWPTLADCGGTHRESGTLRKIWFDAFYSTRQAHPTEDTPMLILRRKRGQWFQITHCRSGDRACVWVAHATANSENVELMIDDPDRDFEIERGERIEAREKERV